MARLPLPLAAIGDARGPRPPEVGFRDATSLRARRAPLAAPSAQRDLLDALPLEGGSFEGTLAKCGWASLPPAPLEVFQVNVGSLCNMTCRHCHVDAGPDRLAENMDRETIDLCLAALDRSTAHTVDVTGGAPELNPHFRYLVRECAARGKHVIDRSNLTVLLLPRFADLPGFLAEHGVEVAASLPHHRRRGTDAQRGDGTFDRSIEALRRLNAAGYGHGDPRRRLTLVANPAGAYLPGSQRSLEREWKDGLLRSHGVRFDRLFALGNMPIGRFLDWLVGSGNLQGYMEHLARSFNPAAVAGLMCRTTLSVAWDGALHDCDFNQMLEIPARMAGGRPAHVRDFDQAAWQARRIATARHCFGCTAGPGSSCGGATT